MLILTKEEVCERISCFEKLISVYNKKIEFLQKLLVYFEKTGRNLDCLVVNVCVQEIQEDMFSMDDQIHVVKMESNIIDNQENHFSSNSHPLSVVDNILSNNLSSTTFSKPTLSPDILTKSINKTHVCFHSAITNKPPFFTDNLSTISSNSLRMLSSSDEIKTNVMTVPKLESINASKEEIEHTDLNICSIKEAEVKTSSAKSFRSQASTVHFLASTQQQSDNVFLSHADFDTANVSSMTMKIKDVKSLNGNSERLKDTKVKQFQCEICPSAFAQKGVLNRHKILRHSPVVNKPHICPNCRKAFTLKHHLKNHLKCKSGCRMSNDFST